MSDNGKSFKAASMLIGAMMQHDQIRQHLAEVGVQWTFNLARSPWQGGVFECMIIKKDKTLSKEDQRESCTHSG